MIGGGGDALVFAEVDAVEQARVEAFPPLALAVGEGEVAVVGDAGFEAVGAVGTEGGLPPPPGVFVVEGDAEADAGGAGGLGPFAEEVALGAEAGGVPRLILGVPHDRIGHGGRLE